MSRFLQNNVQDPRSQDPDFLECCWAFKKLLVLIKEKCNIDGGRLNVNFYNITYFYKRTHSFEGGAMCFEKIQIGPI